MTDPVDLDAIAKRATIATAWRRLWAKESLHAADNLALVSMRAAKELAVGDVPALLAEVRTLRTQLAEARTENGLLHEANERLGAALVVCEHVLHLQHPTDAEIHAAQQASGAADTEWCLTDAEDEVPDLLYPKVRGSR